MFKRLSIFALYACATAATTARGESSTEFSGHYWFDSGEKHAFIPGAFEVSTDGLTEGFHSFHAYAERGNDISTTHTALFFKTVRRWDENKQLTCTVYLDGRLYQTQKKLVGPDGTFCIDLDMNNIDLGMHTIAMSVVSEEGLPLGYRSGVFMRVPTELQRTTFSAYYYIDGKYAGTASTGTNNSAVHLDIDVSELSSGIHSVTAYLASPHGMGTSTKTAWFVKIPAGGEGVSHYSYWLNDDSTTLRNFDLPEVSNPFGLVSLIDVPMQPFRSSSYTFAIENGDPIMYARNEFKIRFSDPDGRVSTGSRTFTDVRAKTIPERATEISNGLTPTGNIAENTVKLFRFDAETGDSVNVRLDRAAMLEIYAPDAEVLIKTTGADAVRNRTFTARENGTYYIAVHDVVSGNSASVDFNHIHKFALLEQNVSHSANCGCFEMEVKGNGFESLESLVLEGTSTEMLVDQYRVYDNYTLVAMIDLDEKQLATGDYRLKGVFNDSEGGKKEEIIASPILTLENPTEVRIDVEIEAPRIAGTPYLTYIKVTNRSNVGVWGVPFNIAAQHPAGGGSVEFMDFEIVLDEKFKETIPVVHKTKDLLNTGVSGSFAQTVIPYLAAGATNTYTIGLTTAPHEIVTFYAWTGKPWSEEIREMQSEDYNLSVIEQPFDGNLFTFTEFCKLYYQLANGIYSDGVALIHHAKLRAPSSPFGNIVNAAAGAVKQAIGNAARSISSPIATRMAGRDMLLAMNGENECVQQMQNTDRGMLMVGNDLMSAADTENNLIGNAQALNHLVNARNHWQESVPPNPNPNPTPVDSYQSGDPNDMTGYKSPSGSNHIGLGVKTLTYTIEFENDPEIANAPASTINVRSFIDGTSLALSSFKVLKLTLGDKEVELPSSHHFVKTLDMRPAINSIAELTFDFNVSTGLAEWKLRSLDPLTLDDIRYMDDGILPVNDDSGRGTGYLTFSIDMQSSVVDATTISSKAEIVFDNNKPITTPVWSNVTDFTVPKAAIVSQSTDDNLTFSFTVEGSDTGSGIWHYDLYMRREGETRWVAVKTNIESDTFSYTSPDVLADVSFAVIATDRAGNRQSERSLDVVVGDADGNGTVDTIDSVVITNYYLNVISEVDTEACDVNKDGIIDTQDAAGAIAIYLINNKTKKQ